MTRQLAYYYRKGKALRKAKSKARKQSKATSIPHLPKPQPFPSQRLTLRLHRFQYSKRIVNAVSEDRLRALKLNDRLNNIRQYLGAGFRLIRGNEWSLELEGIELISDSRLPVAFLKAFAKTMGDNMMEQLALQYGLMLAKEGYTPPTLTEIEMNATQMTDKLKEIEKKNVLELYSDMQGYKIWADWSFGVGGLESNSVEYMERLKVFARDMAVDDAWTRSKERLDRVEGLLLEYGEKLNVHIPFFESQTKINAILLERLGSGNGNLNPPKPRHRKPRQDDDYRQRRLA